MPSFLWVTLYCTVGKGGSFLVWVFLWVLGFFVCFGGGFGFWFCLVWVVWFFFLVKGKWRVKAPFKCQLYHP